MLQPDEPGAPRKLGLRERNKLDKIQRIRRAALEMFESNGYEATTTREIAERADVAIGTLFLYADGKHDLLFLIFNDDLDRLAEQAFAAINGSDSLTEQVLQIFAPQYRLFLTRAPLAKAMLREMVFLAHGKQTDQFLRNRVRLMTGLEELVRQAIDDQRITTAADPALIAKIFFALFSAEVRQWLNMESQPDLMVGLDSLRQTLMVFAHGLGESTTRPAPGRLGVPAHV